MFCILFMYAVHRFEITTIKLDSLTNLTILISRILVAEIILIIAYLFSDLIHNLIVWCKKKWLELRV